MQLIDRNKISKNMKIRLAMNNFYRVLFLLATLFGLVILSVLIYRVLSQGFGWFDLQFLTSFASRKPEQAGIYAALIGSIWLMIVVIPISLILGIGTTLYLEEYASKNKFTTFIQMNISNLAGVPSIVFGLLGLTIFARQLALGRSVLAAALTMSLLVLPVIVVASQEAIRAVSNQLREASYGMGATKWQTILRVVLPAAIPGILTGSILAFSRAIGETAPLVVVGIPTFVAFLPKGVLDTFTVLPLQIYNWAGRPQADFQHVAAAGIMVLLIVLLVMNLIAVLIRNKYSKRY